MLPVVLCVLANTSMFFAGGALIHFWFYRSPHTAHRWKHQPRRFVSREEIRRMLPLVLVNCLIISTLMGLGIRALLLGKTRAYWEPGERGLPYLAISTAALFLFYHLALYYVHRTLHRPDLFRRIHHLHHKHKAPIWLDALYEHPLEALWGGVVLTAPLYLFPVNGYAYFGFLVVVGLHEIVDHLGVKVDLPLLSPSVHHDEHHRRSNCYYGQLLPLLDWLHKTNQPGRPGS